jgi:hypothetical protein
VREGGGPWLESDGAVRILEAAGALGVALGGTVGLAAAWGTLAALEHQAWAASVVALAHLVGGYVAARCGLALIRRRSWTAAVAVAGLAATWTLESCVGLASLVYHEILWGRGGYDLVVLAALWTLACATCSLLSFLSLPLCWRSAARP